MPAESERSCSTASSTTTRRKRSLVLWQRSHSHWRSTFHYAESRPRTAAILFRASLQKLVAHARSRLQAKLPASSSHACSKRKFAADASAVTSCVSNLYDD